MDLEAPIQIPDPSRFTFLKALQRALGRTPLWLAVTAFTAPTSARLVAMARTVCSRSAGFVLTCFVV